MIENTERSERTDQSNIERIVMRRVRLIRLLALIVSTATLAVLTFIATLWGIGREVWVARILQNTPTDFASVPSFYVTAFIHTNLLIQLLTLLTLTSFIFLVREIARAVSSVLSRLRA